MRTWILSVLAQIIIDSCKRNYEIDSITEIERIKKLDCMILNKTVIKNGKPTLIKCDLPLFMKYTKDFPTIVNGTEISYEEIKAQHDKIDSRINTELICPMNWLEECFDNIPVKNKSCSVDTKKFFIKINGKANNRQMTKIRELVENYDAMSKSFKLSHDNRDDIIPLLEESENILSMLKKMKISNPVTINRLIETALGIEENVGNKCYRQATKYTRKMLNLLYKRNPEQFLLNFTKS